MGRGGLGGRLGVVEVAKPRSSITPLNAPNTPTYNQSNPINTRTRTYPPQTRTQASCPRAAPPTPPRRRASSASCSAPARWAGGRQRPGPSLQTAAALCPTPAPSYTHNPAPTTLHPKPCTHNPNTHNPNTHNPNTHYPPKVFYELHAERERLGANDEVAIVRIEQLAPFPFDLVSRELYRCAARVQGAVREGREVAGGVLSPRVQQRQGRRQMNLCTTQQQRPITHNHKPLPHPPPTVPRYPSAEVVWCQEEPMNMGAYFHIQVRGRSRRLAALLAG